MIEVEELGSFISVALSIFGGASVIAGGVSAIIKLLSPIRKLRERVDKNEEFLEKDWNRFKEVEKQNQKNEDANKEICKALLVLLNHEITGNGIEKLKKQRDELEQFLIEKK